MADETQINTVESLVTHVARLKDAAVEYLAEQSKARATAMEYYSGVMLDFPADEGRSSVVSQDVRAVMKKVMPSIMRTILGGGNVVEYLPVGQEDEEAAEQATDYINLVVMQECGAVDAIHDAIHDALLLKTGIIKWSAYRDRKVTIRQYTDQSDEALLGLDTDPDVEMLDYEESEETDPNVLAVFPDAKRHSFRLRRISETVTPRLEAVPRGAFLITPGAESIETAELVGEEEILTRSALVAQGYDKDNVWAIITHDGGSEDDQARMGVDYTDAQAETRKALELVRVWNVYVKVDQDDDGIAEIYRIVFGDGGGDTGGASGHVVLGVEAVDEAPYASVVAERDPHQFEGHSIYEDVREIQRVKTSLMRSTLDNLYAQNNMRPAYRSDAVADPEKLANGKFGEPIELNPGFALADAVSWAVVPFVADKSFQMLSYMDEVATDRTGITDASGGIDANNLHNTSATSAMLMSESGIAQADMIVRSIANGGLRRAFKGLLKLVIAHSDKPRTVRMKNEWVEYNPAVWNSEMDCVVNVGLGGGTKERDMMTLNTIYSIQKELLLSIGADNPYVKPDQLYNTLEKITETAGFPSALPYFTDPDPAEIQARLEAAKNAPDPEVMKIEAKAKADMQIEGMKAQQSAQAEQQKLAAQMQAEKMKADVARDKEAAQMQADLAVKQQEAQIMAALEAQKLAFEREKFETETALKQQEMRMKRELELLKLDAQDTDEGVKNKSELRESSLTDAMAKMIQAFGQANGPKRIIRDENGDVIGVEPVQ